MDVSLIDIYGYTIIFQEKNSGFRTFGNWMNNAFEEKTFAETVSKKLPRNFTKHDLEALLSQCGCIKGQGGRGSGIRFYHVETGRIIAFDEPHPENELYPYQVKMIRWFVTEIGEYKGD